MSSKESDSDKEPISEKRIRFKMHYCHLCKIEFSDCYSLCIHILKKHKPSSELYEGEDKEESDKESTDSEKSDKESTDSEKSDKESTDSEKSDKESTDSEKSDKESTDSEKSDKELTDSEKSDKELTDYETSDNEQSNTVQDPAIIEYYIITPLSHKVSQKEEIVQDPGGSKHLFTASYQAESSYQIETYKNISNGGIICINSSSAPLSEATNTGQPTSSTEATSTTLYDEIYNDIVSKCNSPEAQEGSLKKFDFTVENIKKWVEKWQSLYAAVKIQSKKWSIELLTTVRVLKDILQTFCHLSTDEEAVSTTKEIIIQMNDILQKHGNLDIKK